MTIIQFQHQNIISSYCKIDIKQDIKQKPNINLNGMLIFQNPSILIKAKHLQEYSVLHFLQKFMILICRHKSHEHFL